MLSRREFLKSSSLISLAPTIPGFLARTARANPKEHGGAGWLGMALDALPRPSDGAPDAVLAGLSGPPRALRGNRSVTSTLAHLDDLVLDGEVDPTKTLPKSGSADDLKDF